MTSLLGFLFLALIAFVAVAIWNGWIHVQRKDGRSTIEVESKEIHQAVQDATKEARQLVDRARRGLGGKRSDREDESESESMQDRSDPVNKRRDHGTAMGDGPLSAETTETTESTAEESRTVNGRSIR